MPPDRIPDELLRLDGRAAVVTAAAGAGLGFAAARRLAEAGAELVISDIHAQRLERAADELEARTGRRPATKLCDVRDSASVDELMAFADDLGEGLSVLVNNAGLGDSTSLADMSDDHWLDVIDVNLNGSMRCLRAALKLMLARGRGSIVNMSSVVAWRAQAGQSAYSAAKAGVMALTRAAAMEAAPHVRVNAVAPSFADHPFLAKVVPAEELERLRSREVFGRGADPLEVANVVLFLASDFSSYMTGEVVSVSSQHP